MADAEHYEGREQTLVKHYVLRNYLQCLARIVGTWVDDISYVDCFSGPWDDRAGDLSDTSFAIALHELRQARSEFERRGRRVSVRCMFLERDPTAYTRLAGFAAQQPDVQIETRNASLLHAIPDIQKFLATGPAKSFRFLFIDPTGWAGFDLDVIRPLLCIERSEVLVNFMTEHIRRFVTTKETRPEIIDSFRRLFGTSEVFDRVCGMDDSQNREDELFMSYAGQLRSIGKFSHVCSSVVLHPIGDRTYFHLIYGTHHRKGVEKFKEVEKEAFDIQEAVRAEAQERESKRKTGRGSLFAEAEQPPSHRAVMLRERYTAAARCDVEALLRDNRTVPYHDAWDVALSRWPLVWESDLKDWIKDWSAEKRIEVRGLKSNQRVPRWNDPNHILVWLQ
jgi:three-Cys-motif partner protein